jgi:hypothetical protein
MQPAIALVEFDSIAIGVESYTAGLAAGGDTVIDRIFLPSAHPDIARYLRGMRGRVTGEALGIVETTTVAATLGAADRGLKGADVDLVELKLADRLGGKAYCVFSGSVADAQAAVEVAVDRRQPSFRPASTAAGVSSCQPRRSAPPTHPAAETAAPQRAMAWFLWGSRPGCRV